MHHLVKLPESGGWYLKVNRVTRNANAAVHAANEFNDPPKAGRQFFMIDVTFVNRSKKKDTILSLGQLSAVGHTNVAYDYSDYCGVLPHELDDTKTVFPRGRLTGNICFSVRKKDVRSLELYYTASSAKRMSSSRSGVGSIKSRAISGTRRPSSSTFAFQSLKTGSSSSSSWPRRSSLIGWPDRG